MQPTVELLLLEHGAEQTGPVVGFQRHARTVRKRSAEQRRLRDIRCGPHAPAEPVRSIRLHIGAALSPCLAVSASVAANSMPAMTTPPVMTLKIAFTWASQRLESAARRQRRRGAMRSNARSPCNAHRTPPAPSVRSGGATPNAHIRLPEGSTSGLEPRLVQGIVDVSLLHPTLRAPGLSKAHLLTKPMAFADGNPDPLNRRPMVAYPRSGTPDLTGAPTRRSFDGSGDLPAAEADTMLGAMDLWSAGFRPFSVTASSPTPLRKPWPVLIRKTRGRRSQHPWQVGPWTDVAWWRH